MAFIRTTGALIGSAILISLGACGGGGTSSTVGTTSNSTGTNGGGSTPAPVVDKYIGTWTGCTPSGTTGSSSETLTLTKTSDTTAAFSSASTEFTTTNCGGTGTTSPTKTGAGTWVGTKTIGTETVDEINIVRTGTTTVEKQVIEIRSDGKLYTGVQTGDPSAVIDANGYPSTIDPNGMTKQ